MQAIALDSANLFRNDVHLNIYAMLRFLHLDSSSSFLCNDPSRKARCSGYQKLADYVSSLNSKEGHRLSRYADSLYETGNWSGGAFDCDICTFSGFQ